MNSPLIIWRPDGAAADITFPFSAFVVDALKRAVPSPLRTYAPDTRTWTVAARYVGDIYHILDQAFGGVDVEGCRTGAADRGRRAGTDDPYVVLHLLPTAPDEVVTVVYRTLARLTHPDVGGDHDAMLALNEAYDAIGGRR
jgi:hypothetical protein